MRVEVTYTNAAGSDAATSTPTAVVDGNAPADTTGPSLSGTARDGETLTLDDGVWTGTPTVTYATSGSAATRRAPTAPTSRAPPA